MTKPEDAVGEDRNTLYNLNSFLEKYDRWGLTSIGARAIDKKNSELWQILQQVVSDSSNSRPIDLVAKVSTGTRSEPEQQQKDNNHYVSTYIRTAAATSELQGKISDDKEGDDIVHFLSFSAYDLAHAIRTQQITSTDIVRASLTLRDQVNPFINAIIEERKHDRECRGDEKDFAAQMALREAHAMDEAIQEAIKESGNHASSFFIDKPFAGVPLLMKESYQVLHRSYTFGLDCCRYQIGQYDAPLVQRVKALGFIIIGITNTSEACMWAESYNPVHGRTNNPWDLSRTPGGSSGGSAAATACCIAPVATTADVGGSTRTIFRKFD